MNQVVIYPDNSVCVNGHFLKPEQYKKYLKKVDLKQKWDYRVNKGKTSYMVFRQAKYTSIGNTKQ